MGKMVEIEITDTSSRSLKCKKGDRFTGEHSDQKDWLVGCHYVTVSDEDAETIGEKHVAVGYSCKVLREI